MGTADVTSVARRIRVMSLTIVLPLPPNRANARGHWRGIHRNAVNYLGAAWTRILAQTKPADRMQMRQHYVSVTATLYVWSQMDDDNAVARLKWPLDAMVKSGLIRDDKRPWCSITGIPKQVVDRKRPRVEILLEPVAEGADPR